MGLEVLQIVRPIPAGANLIGTIASRFAKLAVVYLSISILGVVTTVLLLSVAEQANAAWVSGAFSGLLLLIVAMFGVAHFLRITSYLVSRQVLVIQHAMREVHDPARLEALKERLKKEREHEEARQDEHEVIDAEKLDRTWWIPHIWILVRPIVAAVLVQAALLAVAMLVALTQSKFSSGFNSIIHPGTLLITLFVVVNVVVSAFRDHWLHDHHDRSHKATKNGGP